MQTPERQKPDSSSPARSARGAIQQRMILQRILSSPKIITTDSTTDLPKTITSKSLLDPSGAISINTTTTINYFSHCCSSTSFYYFLPVLLWLTIATSFYSTHNQWTICESFYYSVQGGLSIGFGVIPETDDVSRAFTIVHVLCGALGITVMLSLLAETALANVESKLRMKQLQTILGIQVITSTAPPSLMYQLLLGCVTIEVVTAVVWLSLGSLFAYYYQNFTLIQSFYFAVTAASTGGLESVSRDDISLLVTALYCLIAVPLFGIASSKLATIWLQSRTTEKIKEKVTMESMDQEKWMEYALSLDYVTALSPRHKKQRVMDLSEYLCMELTSLGFVQQEHLKVIVDRFMELDADHSGYITLNEAKKSRMVVSTEGNSEDMKRIKKKQ